MRRALIAKLVPHDISCSDFVFCLKIIEPGPRFRKLRALLYKKYPQYPAEAALGEDDSVIIELTPTHVFTWGIE